MKPILLHGHERSLTQIKYNRQGDLLVSVAKDNRPNVWSSHNGERIGTLNGHTGACWCIDISFDSSKIVTGAADLTSRIWDTETGKQISVINTETAVRTVNFNAAGNTLVLSTDARMGKPCTLSWYDLRDPEAMRKDSPFRRIIVDESKITSAVMNGYDECLFTGHESGIIRKYDYHTGEILFTDDEGHDGTIMDLQLSKDRSTLVSASK
eukprot:Ihof_evm3s266 gene=Ihof_evmTU3s266